MMGWLVPMPRWILLYSMAVGMGAGYKCRPCCIVTSERPQQLGELIITILPLIETDTMKKEDIPALVEKTQINMQEVFARTSTEVFERRASRAKAE